MTLDTPSNPFHAAALDRGENPRRNTAQFKVARLLSEHDDVLSVHKWMLIAGRVLAFLPHIQRIAEQDAKPKQTPQLRRQQVNETESETFFVEQAHYHLGGWRDAMAALASMGSVYAADYDADARGADEDDRRLSQAARDDAATADAPRVAS